MLHVSRKGLGRLRSIPVLKFRGSDFLLPVLYNAPGHFPPGEKERRGKWRPSLCASWWQGWIGRGCSEGNVCSQWRPKEGGVAMVTECGVCSPGNRSSQEQMGGLGWAGLMSSSHSYETKHLSTPELLLHICPHKEGPPLPKRSIFHFYCD